jgi:CDP-glycerol glycerophosphotransferase (TagB/SpsB family)
MIDLKQDTLFQEMEKLFGVIASIGQSKKQAILDLIALEENRLKDLLVKDVKKYGDTVPKFLEYLEELAYNIENAEERYEQLKEENETLDTLDYWSPRRFFGKITGRDREKSLAAMKLGIDI